MTASDPHEGQGAPRVLLFSLRNLDPYPGRAVNAELEDVILEVDRARLYAPAWAPDRPGPLSRALGRVGRVLPAARRLAPAVRPPVDEDYELLFVHAKSLSDLQALGPLQAWRQRCRRLACYIDDLFAWTVPLRADEMDLLSQFDAVFLGMHGSVEAVARACGRPTHYLAPGVDALRFCPFPDPPARCIDVQSMGRRSPRTHEALLEHCHERGLFYEFSSMRAPRLIDVRHHRLLTASRLQRSSYLLAYRAKVDAPWETRGQQEMGFRYFEGAAAGAVLLGEAPATPSFQEELGWRDAVIPLPYGTADVAEVLDALALQPERLMRARRRNVVHSLLRHDWAHRWQRILQALDLSAHEDRLAPRLRRLRQRAADVQLEADLLIAPAA